MKYFSEITNKTYDTEDACKKAELEFKTVKDKEENKLVADKSSVSKRKKELSDLIQNADKRVDDSYKELEDAKVKANAILKEARKKADDIIKEASDKVEKETSAKRDLITQFNKEFGSYTVTYTGDRAEEEYKRMMRRMREFVDAYFPFQIHPMFF